MTGRPGGFTPPLRHPGYDTAVVPGLIKRKISVQVIPGHPMRPRPDGGLAGARGDSLVENSVSPSRFFIQRKKPDRGTARYSGSRYRGRSLAESKKKKYRLFPADGVFPSVIFCFYRAGSLSRKHRENPYHFHGYPDQTTRVVFSLLRNGVPYWKGWFPGLWYRMAGPVPDTYFTMGF
jgi:hypothetical protein